MKGFIMIDALSLIYDECCGVLVALRKAHDQILGGPDLGFSLFGYVPIAHWLALEVNYTRRVLFCKVSIEGQ